MRVLDLRDGKTKIVTKRGQQGRTNTITAYEFRAANRHFVTLLK